mmetsp:Transcript_27878/g.55885  ORF Transcript_27878/g.55885 Transcript_27878/m.55885 type:complete len:285 (-) Transcript_27878:172-1026(-)
MWVIVEAGDECILVHPCLNCEHLFIIRVALLLVDAEFDVDLCDLHLESHVSERFDNIGSGFSSDLSMADRDVVLNADTVNWDACLLHAFDHLDDLLTFICASLKMEVVVEEKSIGIGFSSICEGFVDVIRQSRIPRSEVIVCETFFFAIIKNCLIDYIPGLDDGIICDLSDSPHNREDCVEEDFVELFCREFTVLEPVAVTLVVHEGVSSEVHTCIDCFLEMPEATSEIVRSLFWLNVHRLAVVLGSSDVKLACKHFMIGFVIWAPIVKPDFIECRTNQKIGSI